MIPHEPASGIVSPAWSPDDDAVVLTQMAEVYRSLALAGAHYAAHLVGQLQRGERLITRLRDRLAEKDAENAALRAEISRYTASMVAGSEVA